MVLMATHNLHGRVKKFWIFLVVISVVTFIANISAQVIFQGGFDLQRAITLSLTMGIVLAIVMAAQHKK